MGISIISIYSLNVEIKCSKYYSLIINLLINLGRTYFSRFKKQSIWSIENYFLFSIPLSIKRIQFAFAKHFYHEDYLRVLFSFDYVAFLYAETVRLSVNKSLTDSSYCYLKHVRIFSSISNSFFNKSESVLVCGVTGSASAQRLESYGFNSKTKPLHS